MHARPKRERTLALARILDYFSALVLSSDAGCRKRDPAFYQAVLEVAGCDAVQVLWVGDRLTEDIHGPLAAGMQAALVHADPTTPHAPVPNSVPILDHLDKLPELLRELV